jgi:hypothetical protein
MIREYDEWFLPYSKIFHEVTQDRRSHDTRHRHVLVHGEGVTTIAAAPPMLPGAPARAEPIRVPSLPKGHLQVRACHSAGLDQNHVIGQVRRPGAPASSADGALLGLRRVHMKG